MSDESKPDDEKCSDEKPETMKLRDEHGLTLSGRLILRITSNFQRYVGAVDNPGKEAIVEFFKQPIVHSDMLDLLFIGTRMAERIGSIYDVTKYLTGHEEQDDKTIETMHEAQDKKLQQKDSDATEHGNHDPLAAFLIKRVEDVGNCQRCGGRNCISCGDCHRCQGQVQKPQTKQPLSN